VLELERQLELIELVVLWKVWMVVWIDFFDSEQEFSFDQMILVFWQVGQ
jgi:hypothetical protein